MKKNPILSALSLILRNTGRSLQILKYGIIENGWLRITDLEHELKVFVGDQKQDAVMVDVELYCKTNDLQAAIGAAGGMDAKDFPAPIESGQDPVRTSPKVLEGLIDLLPAASTDMARNCLRYVFVNRKKSQAIATDGHLLLLKRIGVSIKESFMIDAISLKIASYFTGNFLEFIVSNKTSVDKSDIESTSLIFKGDGWQLNCKVPLAGEYPSYLKVIPDRSKAGAVWWDKAQQMELQSFLQSAKPFVNQKSQMVHLTSFEGVVKNDDLQYLKRTQFSKQVLPMKPDQVIGVNASILQTVLDFVDDKPVLVTVGETMLQGMLFQGEGCLALVMPLRTAASGSDCITRAELLQDEKVVPMPVVEPVNQFAGLRMAA